MKRITEYTNIETVSEGDVLPIVDVSDTSQASTGSTRKGSIEKIADYIKDRAETLTNKTLTSPVLNTPDINTPDIDGGTIDGSTINGGTITGTDISGGTIASDTNVVEVLKKVYPVGCIYISSVSTSPATLFGFGTWTLVGEGKALFGVDSGDSDFNASEKTGGAKTHTLTTAQMPSHSHRLLVNANQQTPAKSTGAGYLTASNSDLGRLTTGMANPLDGCTDTTTTGSGSAHSILNPYYTAYFYKRTA